MQVHYDIDALPGFQNPVVTVGSFDGVHRGHRKIVELLKSAAGKVFGETVIVTFYPHPRQVIASSSGPVKLLTTLDEKIELLDELGIDHLVVVPFDERFSNLPAESYVRDFLAARFRPVEIVIGYDHRFGHDRQGDYLLLEKMGAELGFSVREIPGQMLDEIAVSSTAIRRALLDSEAERAAGFLGYPYFFSGRVLTGNKLGRTIGFATANLFPDSQEKLIPGNGVYAVSATLDEEEQVLKGMMNIGVRPTVDGHNRVIEVHLFDFARDIYDRSLTVRCHKLLRHERKFNGLEELKLQLAKDRDEAIHRLAGI